MQSTQNLVESYRCPHFSTVESDSPPKSCKPVKAKRSCDTR